MHNWAAQWHSNTLGILPLVSRWGSTTPAERTPALWAACQPEHNFFTFTLLNINNIDEFVSELRPEWECFVEDIERSRPCCVFADDHRQKDLQRHHGYCQQRQLCFRNSFLHQLQTCNCISCREAHLQHTRHKLTLLSHKTSLQPYQRSAKHQFPTLAVSSSTQKVKTVGILMIENNSL